MKIVIQALIFLSIVACGRVNKEQDKSESSDVVFPGELRGHIKVLKPTDVTLPDCNIGYSSYNNAKFTAFGTNGYSIAGVIGESVHVPEGTYKVVINETVVDVKVVRQQVTVFKAGRAEVADVSGHGYIRGNNITGGSSSYALTKLPTGCGVNLTPAIYNLSVTYQGHTVAYQIDLTDW